MPRRPQVTTKQVLLRMDNIGPAGMVDLTSLDLTGVDFKNPELNNLFKKIAAFSKESSAQMGRPYINLTGSDISGVDFSGMDLSNVIFSGVTAIHTNFTDCIMSDTQFDHACANEADFTRADLYHTKFYMTTFFGADFTKAKMKFTHGLGGPNEAIGRLGVAVSVRDAILPAAIENLRPEIEKAVRMNAKKRKDKKGSKFSLSKKQDAPPSIISTKFRAGSSDSDDSGFSDI